MGIDIRNKCAHHSRIWNSNLREPSKVKKQKQEQSVELKNLIANMQRVFSTKVTALGSNKRGRIYIDYYTQDDLDRIYDLIEKLKK